MRLLLIRHGQTIDNVHGALGTVVPGPGLTELGREQAEAIPDALVADGLTNIQAVYVSTMLRTQQTARPLERGLGLEAQVLDELKEISAGTLEGRFDDDAVRTYMMTIWSWWTDRDARIPGGESGTEFMARFDGAIRTIAARHDGTVVLVSHGAAIRTWVSTACSNIDADFSRGHPLDNTGVVIVDGTPDERVGGGWVATAWDREPVGGAELADASASDPTGDAV